MTEQTGSIYDAYDGQNNAFHALADNSVGQAIFPIDDESFEKKISAYKREFYDNSPKPNSYERYQNTRNVRKIYENYNIITVSYDTGSGTELLTEKYCWQYDISFEHAQFFAALMGTETLLYKKGNTITVYACVENQNTVTVYPESKLFEPYGIRTVFELMFRLLDTQKRIITISVPKGIFLQYNQRPYIHGAGMYIPRKSYRELMESAPVIYVSNRYACAAHSVKQPESSYTAPDSALCTDEPGTEKQNKPKYIRNRCRQLIKNTGVLILCTPEDSEGYTGTDAASGISGQAAVIKHALDERPEEIRTVYKTLLFRFLAEDGTPEHKSVTGFYVLFDYQKDWREQLCAAVSAARAAGIAAVLYVSHKKPVKTVMGKAPIAIPQIQVVGTEDAEPVFSLSMQDGYEVFSQMVSVLHSGTGVHGENSTDCKRFLNMHYSD